MYPNKVTIKLFNNKMYASVLVNDYAKRTKICDKDYCKYCCFHPHAEARCNWPGKTRIIGNRIFGGCKAKYGGYYKEIEGGF